MRVMKLFRSFRLLLGAALAAGAGAAAHAQGVISDVNAFATYARNWNLVTLGNATFSGSSDTQGGIAVGGNLSVSGSWVFASNNSDTPDPSLFLNGQLSLSGSTDYQNNGYASMVNLTNSTTGTGSHAVTTTYSFANKSLTETITTSGGSTSDNLYMNSGDSKATIDPRLNAGPTGWNWTTAANVFNQISTNLGGMAQTAGAAISVDAGSNLNFTSTATTGVVIFDLDTSLLSGNTYNGHTFSNIAINVPSGVDYVINVIGLCNGDSLFGSASFNAGSNDNQLLWNFVDTGTSDIGVTISQGGNFYGSILAPKVNITDNTTINGQVVASSFTDNGVELHDLDFTSVVVPEPTTFALGAVVLCGGMVLVGRRLRRGPKSAA
jgi:choice-of-anchor A domain-containing protein